MISNIELHRVLVKENSNGRVCCHDSTIFIVLTTFVLWQFYLLEMLNPNQLALLL